MVLGFTFSLAFGNYLLVIEVVLHREVDCLIESVDSGILRLVIQKVAKRYRHLPR